MNANVGTTLAAAYRRNGNPQLVVNGDRVVHDEARTKSIGFLGKHSIYFISFSVVQNCPLYPVDSIRRNLLWCRCCLKEILSLP